MLRLYDTLTKTLKEFRPINKNRVLYYTCGPSIYNYAHIGNFRTFFWEDILHRYLIFKGFNVIRAMPISDLEDKAINNYREAKYYDESLTFKKFIYQKTKKFLDDFKELQLLHPMYLIKFSDMVEDAKNAIIGLEKKGFAYRMKVKNKNYLFFDVSKISDYGIFWKLKNKGGIRIKDDYSRSGYYDFCLWKEEKMNEKLSDVVYEFPEVGKGRPGNAIYCALIATKYLSKKIDIHAGGTDNKFPHHENEVAICNALYGNIFANYWFHVAHITINKKKMSKRLGNVIYFDDIKDKGFNSLDLRFFYSLIHYRKNQNFTFEELEKAHQLRTKLVERIQELMNANEISYFDEATRENHYLMYFESVTDNNLNLVRLINIISKFILFDKKTNSLSKDDLKSFLKAVKVFDDNLKLGITDFYN
ncbi:MAG: class I tRNA ligase family protein [Candidatus Anstonellales archaeon]